MSSSTTNVRTIWGILLQVAQSKQNPPIIYPHTTLNEKFLIQSGVPLPPNAIPRIGYIGVGNKGSRSILGKDNITISEPYEFMPNYASLYNHLPLVLRTLDNDLSPTERARYRLRKIITLANGSKRIAYYLRVISNSDQVQDTITYNIYSNGQYIPNSYVPTASILNPTPPEPSNYDINYTTANYFKVAGISNVTFDSNDILEFVNVCKTLYGSEQYAWITEIGIFSGYDVNIVGFENIDSLPYQEVLACQLTNYTTSHTFLSEGDVDHTINIQLGDADPIFDLRSNNV